MTSTRRVLRWSAAMVLGAVAAACHSDSVLENGLLSPTSVQAIALAPTSVRVQWSAAAATGIANYRVERRANLTGKFVVVANLPNGSGESFLDTAVQPGTFYGYRIVTVDGIGNASTPSTVAGVLTPPLPGIRVTTVLTSGTVAAIADPNGYQLSITGPVDTALRLGNTDSRLFAPLAPGDYTVTLGDVAPTCTVLGGPGRTVTVVDQGTNTQQTLSFEVGCIDPSLGTIVTVVDVTGDSLDADGFRVDYAGIIAGDTVPVLGGGSVPGTGGTVSFARLRPGDYDVTLSGVGAPCTFTGPASRSITTAAQVVDTVRYTVSCPTKGGNGGPLVWRNTWSPQSAPAGQTVTLDVVVDLSAIPTQDFGVAQATVTYNPAVLQYVSGTVPAGSGLNNLTLNTSTPGTIGYLNLATGTPPTGVVPVARFTFTVKPGATGSAFTRTTVQIAAAGDGFTPLDTLFRVVEDTFAVGTGGGSGNISPSARANGPYSGTAGVPVSFSSSGSSDPDGTIAAYSWSFGDGGTSTLANPTHSYTASGGYTAALTVTDNQGAQGSSQANVTITGGSGNQAPVAVAGGPYTGQAGVAIGFSSSGSSDPDGSIASYSWSFGDGGTSALASPAHTYTAAGSYTAILTVTDKQGATAGAQAAVTVTPTSTTPFVWTSNFGGLESGLNTYPLTITLNLAQDISQTAGPEALGSFAVDSLTWDPAVVQYFSLTFGSGGGSFNTTDAVGGCKCKLIFSGAPSSGSNSGVVPIATVRFRPAAGAASGSTTTTKTGLGPVLSTSALGSFNYRTLIQVVEGTLTLP